jgi:GntR family transcriptional regulator
MEGKRTMLFYVDTADGIPIFRQLLNQVKRHIAAGTLKPGDELPSIRNLSVPLGVNPMTISKAYNLLVHDGILERRPGLPLIVADLDQKDIGNQRVQQVKESLHPVVQLVRQMEMDHSQAMELFGSMLDATGEEIS